MPIKRDKEGVIIEITLTDDEEEELDEEAAAKKKKEEEDALKEVGMKMMETPSSQSTSFWKNGWKWRLVLWLYFKIISNSYFYIVITCFFPAKRT